MLSFFLTEISKSPKISSPQPSVKPPSQPYVPPPIKRQSVTPATPSYLSAFNKFVSHQSSSSLPDKVFQSIKPETKVTAPKISFPLASSTSTPKPSSSQSSKIVQPIKQQYQLPRPTYSFTVTAPPPPIKIVQTKMRTPPPSLRPPQTVVVKSSQIPKKILVVEPDYAEKLIEQEIEKEKKLKLNKTLTVRKTNDRIQVKYDHIVHKPVTVTTNVMPPNLPIQMKPKDEKEKLATEMLARNPDEVKRLLATNVFFRMTKVKVQNSAPKVEQTLVPSGSQLIRNYQNPSLILGRSSEQPKNVINNLTGIPPYTNLVVTKKTILQPNWDNQRYISQSYRNQPYMNQRFVNY